MPESGGLLYPKHVWLQLMRTGHVAQQLDVPYAVSALALTVRQASQWGFLDILEKRSNQSPQMLHPSPSSGQLVLACVCTLCCSY